MERIVVRDTVLPDGTPLSKGTHIAVDGREMLKPPTYENPDEFDGYRFYKRREAGDNSGLLVLSFTSKLKFKT